VVTCGDRAGAESLFPLIVGEGRTDDVGFLKDRKEDACRKTATILRVRYRKELPVSLSKV
jgi:hypothetical protein